MENTVKFYQGMDIDPDDHNNLQTYVSTTFGDLVGDAVTSGQRYAGFTVTKTSSTGVTIDVGRLYSGGKMFTQTAQTVQDFAAELPQAGQKIITVVLLGNEQDTDVTEREFLINQDTGASQPKAVALRHARIAMVAFARGTEAPTAIPVVLQAGYTKVADILLTTSGVDQVTMYSANALQTSDAIAGRTNVLETFQARIEPQVSTLTSGLAALANSLSSSASQGLISRMLLSIAELNAKVGIPTTAADSSIDYLLTDANSDLAHPLSSCKVREGIRFPDDGAQDQILNLFNPFETSGVIKGGVLFPAYDRYARRYTGPGTGTIRANSYTYNSIAYTQKTMTTSRTRYGGEFTVCTNSAFWQQGTYDPISGVFALPDGSTYRTALDLSTLGDILLHAGPAGENVSGTWLTQHQVFRFQQFWTDTTDTTYWDAVVQPPQTTAGYHVFETELIGQNQWLDAVGVAFNGIDTQGDVTLVICEAGENAAPRPDAVLASVTVPVASLTPVGETVFSLTTPILLKAGQRVSYGIITTGAHTIVTTDGASFPQGTFFVMAPNGFVQGDLTKHLGLVFYSTRSRASTVSIQLQNLQLAGGITAIDILARDIVPSSTKRVWEIQVSGVWTPLSAATAGQLNSGGSLPPNLPLRVTMTGTPDMMPCVDLAHSNVHVSRPKTALAHVWPRTARTPPVATSQIRVIERFESYQAAYHSVGCKLLTGSGYTTQTAPTSFSDVIGTDGSLTRTYVYNLSASVTSYKVLTTGTTTSPLNTFHGAYIKDYVL